MRVVLCLLFVFLAVSSQPQSPCGDSKFVDDSSANKLVNDLKAASFSPAKIAVLRKFLSNNVHGFRGTQVAKILGELGFLSVQKDALTLLEPFIFDFSCKDLATVLEKISFDNSKLDAVRLLASSILESDWKVNSQVVLDQFFFDSSKAKAKKILDEAKPRNCVYGPITEKFVVFVVDTSGSMETAFSVGGVKYTRWSYVQKELTDIIKNALSEDQNFNIVSFSDSTTTWAKSLVPATSVNVNSAVEYVSRLTAEGSTNTAGALAEAAKNSGVEAIYLLSDGAPNNIDDVFRVAKTIPNIKINTISLDADAVGQKTMEDLAKMNHGFYRELKSQSSPF